MKIPKTITYHPELKQRGGSIIPVGPVIQSTEEFKTDSLTLLVCLDDNGKATGTLYVDKGEGFGYRNGDFELDTFTAKKSGKTVKVSFSLKGRKQTATQRYYKIGVVSDSEIIYSDWENDNQIKISVKSRL